MTRVHERVLAAFAEWFGSGGGVWQTAIITMAVVVVECADRSLDPHAFALMAVLTVYSAITQPALAYTGRKSDEKIDALLSDVRHMLSEESVVDTKTYDLVSHISKMLGRNE